MARNFTELELEAYLDEALTPAQMTEIEEAVRSDPRLVQQLSTLNARRDAGLHSLGEIWRRHRLSCATREQLGSLLLGVLAPEQADYLRFHIDVVGCRYCYSNLADLQRQQREAASSTTTRRTRYFQSSAGMLREKR
jgi:hypothetical protein